MGSLGHRWTLETRAGRLTLNRPGLYVIRNTVTGGFYFGSSRDLGQRFRQHRHMLRCGKNGNLPLQSAWNEHGESAFEFDVLTFETLEDARSREQRMLDRLFAHPLCYNKSSDAFVTFRGVEKTPESIAKMAASKRGKPVTISADARAKIAAKLRGRPLSPEHRAAVSAGHKGKTLSAEHRAKLSAAQTGQRKTTETIAKQRAAKLGRKRDPVTLKWLPR